jgi:hypothetical protein
VRTSTIVLLAFAAFSCASAPPAAPPAPRGCAVDVWATSWNTDDGGSNDEDQAIANAEVHEHVGACSYADAIRGWLDRAPETRVKKPEKGYDFSPDFRVVARITSSHGSDLVGVSGDCDWVRRNREQFLAYDPSLFKLLMQASTGAARRELEIYLGHSGCGPHAPPH